MMMRRMKIPGLMMIMIILVGIMIKVMEIMMNVMTVL